MAAAAAGGGLAEWAERSALRRAGRLTAGGPVPGRLRFVFYGRVSTEDWQDPVTSRARQREQAEALVRGHGKIVAERFDVGQSRTVAWARRPQSAALIAQLADPDRAGTRSWSGSMSVPFTAASTLRWRRYSSTTASSCGCPRPAAGSTTRLSTMRRR